MPQIAYCPHYTSHAQYENRPPSTRHPPALRTRPAQLTPRCVRRLAGSLFESDATRLPRSRCSRHLPRSGGAAAARGGVAGSSGVCVCPFAHPRLRHIADCPHGRPAQIFRRGCGKADAPAIRHAWEARGPLGWPLQLRLYGASCMWPGALGAKNGRVRMAMWSSEVARGRQEALDSLKLTLY